MKNSRGVTNTACEEVYNAQELVRLKRRRVKSHVTTVFKFMNHFCKGKRNTALQVNGIRSHRLALQAGYINHGKHQNKLEGYKDLTESLDKPVPEITRAADSL